MNNEHEKFLNLLRLPGSIDAEQAAILLGIAATSVPILVVKSFLKPLGKQIAPNAPRRFSSAAIEALTRNPDEMGRMHQIITQHWREKNRVVTSHRTARATKPATR